MATDTYTMMLASVAIVSLWYVFAAVTAYYIMSRPSWSFRKRVLVSVFWMPVVIYTIFRGGK
jgi:hypothetical protein